MLINTRDLARDTKLLLERHVIPKLDKNEKDHEAMGERVDALEKAQKQMEGAYKALVVVGSCAVGVFAIIGVILAF